MVIVDFCPQKPDGLVLFMDALSSKAGRACSFSIDEKE
jgi:hypothetical protein